MTIYFRTPALTEGVSSGPMDTAAVTLPSRSAGDTMYAILTSDSEFMSGTDPESNWALLEDVWGGTQGCRVLYRQATLDANDALTIEFNDAGDYRALVLVTIGRTYPELAASGAGAGGSSGALTVGPITPAVNNAAKVVTVVSLAGTSTLPTSTQGGPIYTDTTPDAYAYWITPEAGPFTIDLPARDGHARMSFRIFQAVVTYLAGEADDITRLGGVVYPELPYGLSATPFNSRGYAQEGPQLGPFTRSQAAALLAQAYIEHDNDTVSNIVRTAPLVWTTDPGVGGTWQQWAASNHTPAVVEPTEVEDTDDGVLLWSPEDHDSPPPGVIGWEWPDGNKPGNRLAADLLDVLLNVTSDEGNVDRTTDPPTSLAYSTVLYAQTEGVTFATDPQDGITEWDSLSGAPVANWTSELGEDARILVSVVDYLNDDLRCLVYARAPGPGESAEGPEDPTAFGEYAVGNDPQYGFYDSELVYWIYRPLPFQWITSFTEITGSPALRLYPRDGDGRGLGGVTRLYPPPRSKRLHGHQP